MGRARVCPRGFDTNAKNVYRQLLVLLQGGVKSGDGRFDQGEFFLF